MITFWIGAMVGCVVGVGAVCFFSVVAEEDRWLEKKAWERKHGRDTHQSN